MGCSRGKANPSQNTRIRLFADSAGYCQNPSCINSLFVDLDSGPVHIAEMAHIFAANDDGPRANPRMSEEERGAYDNLILLCSNCHTVIDKAPDNFPDPVIRGWKRQRQERLAALFGAVHLRSREEVRSHIEPLMHENKASDVQRLFDRVWRVHRGEQSAINVAISNEYDLTADEVRTVYDRYQPFDVLFHTNNMGRITDEAEAAAAELNIELIASGGLYPRLAK